MKINSVDIAYWQLINSNPGWSKYGHATCRTIDGKIILSGGNSANDVWMSDDDGLTWTLQTASAPWGGRSYHQMVATPSGAIILMGGENGSTYYGDVWKSLDSGITWTQMTSSAGWTSRTRFAAVYDNGYIVMMGGTKNFSNSWMNDVWRSSNDGATWTQMTASAAWSTRHSHTAVSLSDNSIVLMAGIGQFAIHHDAYRSTDYGTNWSLITITTPGWEARQRACSAVLSDGSIALVGGTVASGTPTYQDVWRSTDKGATWTEKIATSEWAARYGFTIEAISGGKLVLMGGNTGPEEVWKLRNSLY